MKKNTKRILFWVLAILIVVIGVKIVLSAGDNGPSVDITTDQISDSDWVKGTPGAAVVLIEYSDFQCPACSYYSQVLNDIVKEFEQHIVLAYRHFPLRNIHLHADMAAQAANAAGRQEKFWEMHDLLFAGQKEWSTSTKGAFKDTVISYAEQLGLDMAKFEEDLENEEANVDASYEHAQDVGISYTPTIILNGEVIENKGGYEGLRAIIKQKLDEQNT